MPENIFPKVKKAGKSTALTLGLAFALAITLGMASTAMGANGGSFILGKANNTATQVTGLISNISDTTRSALSINNTGGGPALDLQVNSGQDPMKVNSSSLVDDFNADLLDGQHAGAFLGANAAAGGELDGTYPNPIIRSSVVDGDNVIDESLTGADIDDGSINSADLNTGSVTGSKIDSNAVTTGKINNGAVQASDLATLPAVRATTNNPQSIPTNTPTLIALDAEDFDQVGTGQSGEMHSTTTNNSRLLAPRDGIYQINVGLRWGGGANISVGAREARLLKNNNGSCAATSANTLGFDNLNAVNGFATDHNLSTLASLNQGEYVEVCGFQSSGDSTPMSASATMNYVSAD
ncbi:MAG: hypothetical protein ACRDSJ_09510 [Rubrobacteraceae bacterium]